MKSARIASAVLFTLVSALRAGAELPPIDVYAKLAAISQIEISSDGFSIAFMKTASEGSFLMVMNLDTGVSRKLDVSDIKPRRILWSGPNHVLLEVTKTLHAWPGSRHRIETGGVFGINIRTGTIKPLLGRNKNLWYKSGFTEVSAVTWQEDGSVFMPAVVSQKVSSTPRDHLMKVSADTGHGKSYARGGRHTWDWVVTPAGRIVARVDYHSKLNDFSILVPKDEMFGGRSWHTIFKQETKIPDISVVGINGEKNALVISGRIEGDRRGLYRMSLVDGTIEAPVYEHPQVDVDYGIVDDYTGVVVGVSYTLDAAEQLFFDSELQKVLVAARNAIPNQRIYLRSWDMARNRFIVKSEGPSNAGTFFLFDIAKRQLMELAKSRPELGPEHLSIVTPLHYTARDGLEIPAFLTLPRGAKPESLALVVLPHGGPESRDAVEFDWWAQALASRGYAVLQMNFRGSSGYGKRFVQAGHGEYGGKMQDDITDGVLHLIDEGIADPKRICIVGGSYGGYATLFGAVFTPDLYQCAVSYAGISDLAEKMRWVKDRLGSKSVSSEYWEKFLGTKRVFTSKKLHDRSPANFADRVKASVLLIHGKDDTVVDIKQSKIMFRALKKAGKEVEFITLDGEDHWLSVESSRIETLKAMEDFLARHLRPNRPS